MTGAEHHVEILTDAPRVDDRLGWLCPGVDDRWGWECFTCGAEEAARLSFDDAEHDAQRHREGR